MRQASWEGLLPDDVARALLERWSEPHRHYHSVTHLESGLVALEQLGGRRLEQIAFWFHDAVHSNQTPADETASAAVAEGLLADHLSSDEIAEVVRLIMLTAGHRTEADDGPGQRVCDADLSGLGAEWEQYSVNVAGIRAELPHLTDHQWREGRSAFLSHFVERDHLFATELGRDLWEQRARENLRRELDELRSS